MRFLLSFVMAWSIHAPLSAQVPNAPGQTANSEKKTRKHRFYAYWGWNRSWYSVSDIRFKGNTYDFTLKQVKATDRQSPVDPTVYMNPGSLTIPQTDFRIGYHLNAHWDVSFGTDHMKYVMVQDQVVSIEGTIQETASDFNGQYNGEQIQLTSDFLKFEHTDGLNYINLELRRSDVVLDFNSQKPGKFYVSLTEGVGAGALLPRTNTTLLGNERYDEFHLSGFGINAVAGLNVTLWKNFFLQGEAATGYINMPDIRTTKSKSDKASQHFTFLETKFVFGFRFAI